MGNCCDSLKEQKFDWVKGNLPVKERTSRSFKLSESLTQGIGRKYMVQIIKIQAIYRGHKARKEYKKL